MTNISIASHENWLYKTLYHGVIQRCIFPLAVFRLSTRYQELCSAVYLTVRNPKNIVMNISLKLKFLALLLSPFITGAVFYVYTTQLEEAFNEYPVESALNVIDTAVDKERIRAVALVHLNGYLTMSKKRIDVSYKFSFFLFTMAFLNALLIHSVYKYYQALVSNKASNLTGANDAPSS